MLLKGFFMHINYLNQPLKQKQTGLTFIEVMVALIILVTGILGAVALQATAKQGSFNAMQRSIASSLVQDIIERMRNNNSLTLESYEGKFGNNNATAAAACDENNPCGPAAMVNRDLFEWEQALMGANIVNGVNNVGGLSGAMGCIVHTSNAVVVTVSWQGRTEMSDAKKIDTCGVSGDKKRRQVTAEVFIF